MNEGKCYAKVEWSAEDIQTLRPHWTLEQCEKWLADNEGQIQDRLTEVGFETIDILLDVYDISPDQSMQRSADRILSDAGKSNALKGRKINLYGGS